MVSRIQMAIDEAELYHTIFNLIYLKISIIRMFKKIIWHYTPARIAKMKKSHEEDEEQLKLSYYIGGSVNWHD